MGKGLVPSLPLIYLCTHADMHTHTHAHTWIHTYAHGYTHTPSLLAPSHSESPGTRLLALVPTPFAPPSSRDQFLASGWSWNQHWGQQHRVDSAGRGAGSTSGWVHTAPCRQGPQAGGGQCSPTGMPTKAPSITGVSWGQPRAGAGTAARAGFGLHPSWRGCPPAPTLAAFHLHAWNKRLCPAGQGAPRGRWRGGSSGEGGPSGPGT